MIIHYRKEKREMEREKRERKRTERARHTEKGRDKDRERQIDRQREKEREREKVRLTYQILQCVNESICGEYSYFVLHNYICLYLYHGIIKYFH